MHVASIGLGNMGRAIADRLLDGGHELTVWNRTVGKADSLVARGAVLAENPAAAASAGEAVVVSLTDDAAVRAVMTGESGVAAGLGPGGTVVDMSTVAPSTTSEMSAAVGGRFLASPILGGPPALAKGEATYLVAGPEASYAQLAPMFAALADEQHRRWLDSDAAVATTLKLLSNYLLMSGIAVLAEIVPTAQAAGLPDDLVTEYLGDSPLVAAALHNRIADLVSGSHEGWFSTSFGAKDVRLAEDLGRSHGIRLPLADAVKRRYEEAAAQGWADSDISAVVELVRKHA